MVICDCGDVDARRARAASLDVRVIEDRDYPGKAHLLQLHPRDTGGCILEFDHHVGGAALDGAYHWAGPAWQQHVRTGRVVAINGVVLQSDRPVVLAERWSQVIGRPVVRRGKAIVIALDNAELSFAKARDGRGEGLSSINMAVRDIATIRDAAAARGLPVGDDWVDVCGTRFLLVAAN